jgi:hypothetical protein
MSSGACPQYFIFAAVTFRLAWVIRDILLISWFLISCLFFMLNNALDFFPQILQLKAHPREHQNAVEVALDGANAVAAGILDELGCYGLIVSELY